MIKLIHILFFFTILISCKKHNVSSTQAVEPKLENQQIFKLYSEQVKDTFTIFVGLPEGIGSLPDTPYPVVYLLDANFYFSMVYEMLKKYNDVGLIKPLILIGIGYNNLHTMDSLRCRDYTYPQALTDYEMSTSGGAKMFLEFIKKELNPKIEKEYSVDTFKRILMGHSLGGYFTIFALLHDLSQNDVFFNGYIAASPSCHYNNNYILETYKHNHFIPNKRTQLFVTFGGLEDQEDHEIIRSDTVIKTLDELLRYKIKYHSTLFSNLGHMETAMPSFHKGLQSLLEVE